MLAAASVLAVGVLVVARGAAAGFGGVAFASAAPPGAASAAGAAGADFVLFRFEAVGILLGIPISIFSLGNHSQVIPCFCELAPRLQRRFMLPLLAAVGSCVLLYCSTGAFGYAAFRDATRGDVLLNFPAGADELADAAKALLGVHVVLAYPVLLWPCRQSIATLLRALSASAARRAEGAGSAAAAAAAAGKGGGDDGDGVAAGGASSWMPRVARGAALLAESPLAQSAALVLSTCGLAVLVPEVATVFGLVGSTAATFQIFVLPGLLLRRWAQAWGIEEARRRVGAGADAESGNEGGSGDGAPLLGDGAAVLPDAANSYAPYGDTWGAADRERVWAGAVESLRRSEAEGKLDADARVLPAYLSQSSATLYAQSYFLVCFGAFVMVGSTAMYVWTTWLGGGG